MTQRERLNQIKSELESALNGVTTELDAEAIDSKLDETRLYHILSRNTELTHSEIVEIVKTEMETI